MLCICLLEKPRSYGHAAMLDKNNIIFCFQMLVTCEQVHASGK